MPAKSDNPGQHGRFYRWKDDRLIVNVLGTAGAKTDAIGKVRGDRLKVSVRAAPEAGKATRHMVKFLAAEFGVAPSAVRLVYGEASRNKQFCITAPGKLPAGIEKPTG